MITFALSYKFPTGFNPSVKLLLAAIEFVLECGLCVVVVAALRYL